MLKHKLLLGSASGWGDMRGNKEDKVSDNNSKDLGENKEELDRKGGNNGRQRILHRFYW